MAQEVFIFKICNICKFQQSKKQKNCIRCGNENLHKKEMTDEELLRMINKNSVQHTQYWRKSIMGMKRGEY